MNQRRKDMLLMPTHQLFEGEGVPGLDGQHQLNIFILSVVRRLVYHRDLFISGERGARLNLFTAERRILREG